MLSLLSYKNKKNSASRIRKTSQRIKASSSALRLCLHTSGTMGMWCEYYTVMQCHCFLLYLILSSTISSPLSPKSSSHDGTGLFHYHFAVILKCLAPFGVKLQCTYHQLFEFNFRHQINGDRLAMGSLDLPKDIFHL